MPETSLISNARLWRRFAAMLYDGFLILALWLVTLLIMVIFNRGDAVFGAVVQSILFLELFMFFTYFWIADGQTIGMKAWRLRLVMNSGRGPSLNQVTVRFIAACISFAALGLGYWWVFIDKRNRTWPDILSDSQIIHEP